MSLSDQLGKSEPARPARAIAEADLVRCWSFVHHPIETENSDGEVEAHPVMRHPVSEVAEWEDRIREKGWRPFVETNATREAFYIFAHAVPPNPHLEAHVEHLDAAVRALSANVEAITRAFEELRARENPHPAVTTGRRRASWAYRRHLAHAFLAGRDRISGP